MACRRTSSCSDGEDWATDSEDCIDESAVSLRLRETSAESAEARQPMMPGTIKPTNSHRCSRTIMSSIMHWPTTGATKDTTNSVNPSFRCWECEAYPLPLPRWLVGFLCLRRLLVPRSLVEVKIVIPLSVGHNAGLAQAETTMWSNDPHRSCRSMA